MEAEAEAGAVLHSPSLASEGSVGSTSASDASVFPTVVASVSVVFGTSNCTRSQLVIGLRMTICFACMKQLHQLCPHIDSDASHTGMNVLMLSQHSPKVIVNYIPLHALATLANYRASPTNTSPSFCSSNFKFNAP